MPPYVLDTKFERHASLNTGTVVERGKLTSQQSYEWGKLVGEIHNVFQHQAGYPLIRERNTLMSWINTPMLKRYVEVLETAQDRALIKEVVSEYEKITLPKLLGCKRR